MAERLSVAVDLGAGSGRVFVGAVSPDSVTLDEAHRFHYEPRKVDRHLRWNFERLVAGIISGLRFAAEAARARGAALESVGVDSWGVDYGLLEAGGRLVEDPICYRDDRTAGVMEQVFLRLPRAEIFEATGLQFLELNTLFQLAAHLRDGLPPAAARLLMIPDLCHNRLCGAVVSERTDASTSQLLNARTGKWDDRIVAALGLNRRLLPDLVDAGADLGPLGPELRHEPGLGAVRVIVPATHDTASAVAGTPLRPGWAYISSGTWSLVGIERDAPLLGDSVLRANFTNERGAGGTTRFLKNVMGLWILESCRREWRERGREHDLGRLLAGASARPGVAGLIDPDAPRFFNPSSMPREVAAALAETRQSAAEDPIACTKVVLDSLALRYASVLRRIDALTGTAVRGIHVVGGGSQNRYLNQATANATGLPVLAGPIEATALGNVLIQSIACGRISSIAEGREAIAARTKLVRYEPREEKVWREAQSRFSNLFSGDGSGGDGVNGKT